MVIGVRIGKLQNQSRHACLLIIRCYVGGVFGHEDVGRDAATAVYRAADVGVIFRSGVLDAVLIEELSVLIAADEIFLVALVSARGVGLLYTSACRSVVAGNGKTNHRPVVEGYRLLYEALAERAAADDGAAVVVLNGSRENLGCRCRTLVDENHERYVLIAAPAVAAILLPRRLATLRVYYQSALRQELVGYLNRRREITAGVAAQVDNQIAEVLLRQLGQGYEHVGIGVLAEVLYLYVTRRLIKHIRCADAPLRNVAAGHRYFPYLLLAVAQYAKLHLRVFRPF